MKPVSDPMLRRLLAERYPSPLAKSLIQMTESVRAFGEAVGQLEPHIQAFAKFYSQLQGRSHCRMCGRRFDHHQGCPLERP
ncbi:hypothetical protein [Deinococcus aquatilis]|uniref:hypothetical protein n=1 Tax=Deinococcus aquatilis TaxID=519440 RepID=UPI000370B9B8|nr:hypothetical protein [Deinococcus aquatilis]